LAKKLAINLIFREQVWFPNHINTGTIKKIQIYKKMLSRKYLRSKELFA
jgi:hypothetical protein